jgi:large subunit ribosomal protein L19
MRAHKLTKETIRNIAVTDRGFPQFGVGDTIEVGLIVKEGNKERIQKFLGDVIAMHNKGISSTFTVRKMGANNIGVEKIFPFHAPMINNIKVVKKGDVCRSKLYYIRKRVGKAARIKEKIQAKKTTKAAPAKVEKPEEATTSEE